MSDTDSQQPGPRRPWSPPPEPKGPGTQVRELKDLVVTYAKQETIDPLKTLGRHLGLGISGSILIGIGWVFALLAILRGLQQIDFFNDPGAPEGGTWSWMPYLIVTVVGAAVAGLYGRALAKRLEQNGDPK
ncbi:MAG: phage holin family protein [Microthrixaceae bacterium]|nr:phage holin family protein [Microthrixaceae bacterium]MCB1010953.1 phage holin family protein [Microthrixaceae bacterium]MCB9386657.1 phage holin family protein [Microthrixaceae bacterium]MCO5319972.1 phage holin family protein [Microthrixaceae bacterium]